MRRFRERKMQTCSYFHGEGNLAGLILQKYIYFCVFSPSGMVIP